MKQDGTTMSNSGKTNVPAEGISTLHFIYSTMFKVIRIKNFRRGNATNSSSTHSIIYRNENELFEDLNVFENDYFDRCTNTIAATKEAKIKYIFHHIWHNESLVEKMAMYYPEVKQYYHLAKAQAEWDGKPYEERVGDEPSFGEYTRDSIVSTWRTKADPDFGIDYIRHIIDTDDLVIVGGSDEQEFVYDTIADHDKAPITYYVDDITCGSAGKKNSITKNGNYYVAYGETAETRNDKGERGRFPYRYCSGGRLRFMTEDGEPVPEYPELIDLRITNKCEHNCDFCYMASSKQAKHADYDELVSFVNGLKTKTEFSIGGGNILLYPNLDKLFMLMNNKGHIVNTTINVKDCETIIKNKKFKKMFGDYVDGIGVSVFSAEDVKTFFEFQDSFKGIGGYSDESGRNYKYIVMHIVPEYIGFDKTLEIVKAVNDDKKRYANILFLGYKDTGRGKACNHETFTEKQICELFKGHYDLHIDTSFAKRYGEFIKKTYSTRFCLTENEGEYSMYVDGLTMNAYKSSYETEKPYFIGMDFSVKDWKRRRRPLSVKDAFAAIRADNGFPVFKEKHYWDEEEQ